MNYICHSGGCLGSDMEWENECLKYGIKTIAYSFYNHSQQGRNQKILTVDELNEGFENVKIASKGLKKSPNISYPYVRNLLCRNWYQVKNSDAIFAIGKFKDNKRVDGGTGWAVQMAIDNNKLVFVFDQNNNKWNKFCYDLTEFKIIDYIPRLTENFAGIGTRDINENGKNAIKIILSSMFSSTPDSNIEQSMFW